MVEIAFDSLFSGKPVAVDVEGDCLCGIRLDRRSHFPDRGFDVRPKSLPWPTA